MFGNPRGYAFRTFGNTISESWSFEQNPKIPRIIV